MDIAIGYDAKEKDTKLLVIGKGNNALALRYIEVEELRKVIEEHFSKWFVLPNDRKYDNKKTKVMGRIFKEK